MKLFKQKPKTDRETETLDENYNSHLAATGDIIEEVSGRDTVASIALTLGGGIKFAIGIILFAVIVLTALYTFLAGTLMLTTPSSGSHTDRIWVARGTFQGGQIDSGKVVYGSASVDASTEFVGKIVEGYIGAKDYFVVKTIVGPVAEITSKNGIVYINGSKTEYKADIEKTLLRDQYFAQCVEGSCKPGEYVIVDYASVVGEVRGVITPTGIKDING